MVFKSPVFKPIRPLGDPPTAHIGIPLPRPQLAVESPRRPSSTGAFHLWGAPRLDRILPTIPESAQAAPITARPCPARSVFAGVLPFR